MTSTTSNPSTPAGAAAAVAEVASGAKEEAISLAGASVGEATSVARDAKQHTKEVLSNSREQLRAQADEQFRTFATTVNDIGRQLTGMANGQPQAGVVADVTNDLAASVSRFGERADQRGFDGALDDVKRFARTRPGLFLLASLGGGVVVGRLLRASDPHALADAAKSAAGGEADGSTGATTEPSVDLTAGLL